MSLRPARESSINCCTRFSRVVSCLAGGRSNRSIAEELYLSRHTVDAHLKHVYLKLDIHSRVELTVLAMQHRVHVG